MARVDIVIPVHNALDYLRLCINSLYLYTSDFNLILVSDKFCPRTEEYVQDLADNKWCTLLHSPPGAFFTAKCNIGIKHSTLFWILLLNADIEITQGGWLEQLINCAERWHSGIVGCKLLNPDGTISHGGGYGIGFHYGINEPNLNYFEEREVEWVTGAAMLIRQAVVTTCGLMDDRYVHVGSDREYCYTARRYGFSIVYSPVSLLHYGEKSRDTVTDLKIQEQHMKGVF